MTQMAQMAQMATCPGLQFVEPGGRGKAAPAGPFAMHLLDFPAGDGQASTFQMKIAGR